MTAQPGIAVFARIGGRPIPRVARMMIVAKELGFEPVFCGAMREEGLSRTDTWDGWSVVRLGRVFPLLNGTRPFLYLKSVIIYNWQLLKFLREKKPGILHASDIETMPAMVTYRLISKSRLVYNIHDNLAQRYEIPGWMAAVLNFFEGVCVRMSHITIVPETFRRDALPAWCRKRVAVIRNTPVDVGYAKPEFNSDQRIRIFFGGWLDWGRGLRALITMAEREADIELRIAGEGSAEIVEELKNNEYVTYLGFLDHDQVMQETRRCHFIPALYDPVRVINRYAASNKLAEALSIGRPVILNSEMLIAEALGKQSCVITAEYAKADTLAPHLRQMVQDREAFLQSSIDARQIYERLFAWSPVREKIRAVLLGENPDT